MSKLYLYNYNNYFNRIVKRETSLAGYGTPIYTLAATNFNYNDGVETYHDINYAGFDGNYLIVTDDNDNIVSRWFIKENKRLRGGQHRITLRRDLIVDNYDKIIKAPALINRAIINNKNNPLLFNSEGFSFNQIKQNEIKLTDPLASRWYYLYFKKGLVDKTITIDADTASYDWEVAENHDAGIYASGTKKTWGNDLFFGLIGVCDYVWIAPTQTYIRFKQYSSTRLYDYFESNPMRKYLYIDQDEEVVLEKLTEAYGATGVYNLLKNNLETDLGFTPNITEQEYNKLLSANGKKIKFNDGIYNINVVEQTIKIHNSTSAVTTPLTDAAMKNIFDNSGLTKTGDYGDDAFYYDVTQKILQVSATLSTDESESFTISFTNRATNDSDYNILAFPADGVTFFWSPLFPRWFKPNFAKKVLDKIAISYTQEELVDIQLLPYGPTPQRVVRLNNMSAYPCNLYGVQAIIKPNSEGEEIGFIQYVLSSNYSFDINISLSINQIGGQEEYINYKIDNECNVYRLCSPNFNGIFEFSLAKNNGVDYFNVDISLKPINPYIHLNPNFKFLYGQDFDDNRGLICGGDFSLPKYSSQWAEYELNNKNFQLAFDRQIQHMDFEFSKQRTEALFGATMGAVGGAMSGAVGGSVVGGSAGAGAGALIGGIASAVGGAIDYNILKERQGEQKDLMIDNFKYQLGNIKALPYNINKITPLTYNNKRFPFIEIYSCTDKEKDILINKITFNSMTVNAIGSIQEYLQTEKTYISASLIRLEDLDMPTHEANEIYDEILKGVYI